jgi:hypothetical protein
MKDVSYHDYSFGATEIVRGEVDIKFLYFANTGERKRAV